MMVLYERGAQNHKSRHEKSNGRTKVFGPETMGNSPGSQWPVSLMWKAERKTTFLIKRKLQLWKNDHKNPIEDVKVLIQSTAMKHGWELALKNRLGFNSVRCTVVYKFFKNDAINRSQKWQHANPDRVTHPDLRVHAKLWSPIHR